jgi:YtkA-like protein
MNTDRVPSNRPVAPKDGSSVFRFSCFSSVCICVHLWLLVAVPAQAQQCAELKGARKVESERYSLAYRTQPARLAVGQHFVVEMAVCPKSGEAAPEAVRVDGFMPEHNHGMNYKATVRTGEGGRYLADGMMFHMPGRWDFIFEVRGGGKTDRMTQTVILQ